MLQLSLLWGFRWLLLVLLLCLAGAFAGAILFPVAGHLLRMELGTVEMIRNGLLDGGFLALIWAPGISLVACIMWGQAGKSKNQDKMP